MYKFLIHRRINKNDAGLYGKEKKKAKIRQQVGFSVKS